MPVNGRKDNSSAIKRKVFLGDPAATYTPPIHTEPYTPRGKRRREKGHASRKTPDILIKGLAHRPHSHPSKLNGPSIKGHIISENHAKQVLLTRAYKRNK